MTRVPPEIRAAALADLLAGEPPAVVAQRYRINADTVRQWKSRHVTPRVTGAVTPDGIPAPIVVRQPIDDMKHLTLSELVAENLRAKLIAVQRLAEHAQNEEWLQKQTASDVAELFEVLDRSAIGVLDRLAAAQRSAGPDTEPDAE